ncbi:MAG: hypothetical protein HC852_01765 [Acaryochloridaceae cyanobacterium RU_4_10]|nr:hypothetical protein [Acaryochloridaceae cyanobacterium RU_4_10]
MTNDYMLRREDIQKILSVALVEKGIELDSERFEKLFDQFLESESEIDQTKQPITDQIERFAREFLLSSSAQSIWNDADPG